MTEPDGRDIVKDIFAAAIELEGRERSEFVERSCGDDEELITEVRSWLASYEESRDFIETPILLTQTITGSLMTTVGRQFGSYRIVREIGRGGMGAVFLAERVDGEFEQQVALKIVRQAIAETYVVERFRRERQILATLNHPFIARLLDGGVSDNGEPFLVMEYVEGSSIIDFANACGLSLRERLKMFVKVCDAVSYAHRNLIVHRDLKPANILITENGEPRLLDFGLARLLDPEIGAETTQTAFRALTPAYASPEELCNETVTTASDTYSLGVVLFELLTGGRPFELEGKTLDAIIRTVGDREPKLPSRTAANPSGLNGDLDNIILAALRKEPERRYASVAHFAADINNYLEGRPVSSRPNSITYRASRYVRRHKVGVGASLIVLAAILTGLVVSLWQAHEARLERTREAAISQYLQTILDYSDNTVSDNKPRDHEMTVREALDQASRRLSSGDLASQPEVAAELYRIIGSSYISQGNYAQAEPNLIAARDLDLEAFGPDSPENIETLVELGQLYIMTGEYNKAAGIYADELKNLRQNVASGNIEPIYLMASLNDLALVRRAQGDSAAAEELLREGNALASKIPSSERISVGESASVLALILSDQGKIDEGEKIVRDRIADIQQTGDVESVEMATNLVALGNFRLQRGDADGAFDVLTRAETLDRRLMDPRAIQLADCLRLEALAMYLKGSFADAEKKADESLGIYGDWRPQLINYPSTLAVKGLTYARTGRVEQGELLLRQALEVRERYLPRDHFLTAENRVQLAECLGLKRQFGDAEPLLLDALRSFEASQQPGSPRIVRVRTRLHDLYAAWGKPDLARQYAD